MPESVSNKAGICAAICAMSPVILFMPAACPSPVETMVILSMFCKRRGQRPCDLGQTGYELVHNRGLVPFLVRFGAHVHGFCFRFTFLENDLGFGFALRAGGGRAALRPRLPPCARSPSAVISIRLRSISARFKTVAINSFS